MSRNNKRINIIVVDMSNIFYIDNNNKILFTQVDFKNCIVLL
jgi:hypothetical protein